MVPEVKLESFARLCERNNLVFPKAILNIVNQNALLMPTKSVIDSLRDRVANITMTTAHCKYSNQETATRYGVPVKHISTYLSFRDFEVRSHREKDDLILYSFDQHLMKQRIMSVMRSKADNFEHRVVLGMRYEEYLHAVQRSKYSVSFGEGLDNYFIEACFSGGIGFAVYHATFMLPELLEFDNVFTSYSEMERRLPGVIARLEEDECYRKRLWRQNYQLLSGIYDDQIYSRKLMEYLDGSFDYFPKYSAHNESLVTDSSAGRA
jgi:hypothetical protein